MTDEEKQKLISITISDYLQKASTLKSVPRVNGSNSFRHCMNTFTILLDYHTTDPITLKAAIIHDLLEDFSDFDINEIRNLPDGNRVLEVVIELSQDKENESKTDYLKRLKNASPEACAVKVADRIDNFRDIRNFRFSKITRIVSETKEYIIPIIKTLDNKDMLREIEDLCKINSPKNILKSVLKQALRGIGYLIAHPKHFFKD